MNEQPGVVGEPSGSVLSDIALVGAASLGIFSIVLAAAAAYFVLRNQGVFYKAKVRATHIDDQALEPGDG